MEKVKFSVFSDLHYRPNDWNWASQRLKAILERAEREKVDFIMHCGDFCHNVHTAKAFIDRYNAFSIPTYHTMGNHEFEQTDGLEVVTEAYKMKDGNYYRFDLNGIRMISLDTNYYRAPDGSAKHYAFDPEHEKCHQGESCLPPEEEEFLVESVAEAPGVCVIFSHHSLIRPDGLNDRQRIRARLAAASHSRPILWINGHYHHNNLQLFGNMAFFTLNSTTSLWLLVPHNFWPKEFLKKFHLANHCLLYDTPVHAVVTVAEDGTVKIEGMEGKMFMGITCEQTANAVYDSAGLPCEPKVLSAHFQILSELNNKHSTPPKA